MRNIQLGLIHSISFILECFPTPPTKIVANNKLIKQANIDHCHDLK